MDNNSDEKFIITQSIIEPNEKVMKSNRQDSVEKMLNIIEDFKAMLASNITSIKYHINMLKYFPDYKDEPKTQEPTTVFPDNRRYTPLAVDTLQRLVAFGISNMI